jgi:polyferredoxin
VLFYAAVLAGSVFLGFVFIAYFVEPRDLIRRLARLDVETAGGIAGAVTTAITFADFTWVRQKFCTTVCPYGYLQGMLQDGNTLVVSYQPDEQGCIECKKCVRVCHMGIDIRNSAHQMECVHCGECIDACEDVLGRLKAPRVGLIHYTWGEGGERLGAPGPWWRKLGIRDTKRGIAVAVMMLYGAGLLYSLSSRRGLLVNIMPERSTLYTVGPDGRIHNRFRLRAANRQNAAVSVRLALARLERARILLPEEALKIGAFETRDLEFDVAAPAAGGPPPGVSHFQFIVQTEPGQKTELVPMTFIMPEKRQP